MSTEYGMLTVSTVFTSFFLSGNRESEREAYFIVEIKAVLHKQTLT